MTDKPLLFLPSPTRASKAKKNGGGGRIHYPSHQRQVDRIAPKFQRLEEMVNKKQAYIRENMVGVSPEQTLVIETIGTIEDFYKAVVKIEGLEWLAEIEEQIDSDDDFFTEKDGEREEGKELNGRLFMMMSDQQAITELKSLWRRYNQQEKFDRGFTKWRDLFTQLKDIRLWDIRDRFHDTGLWEDWNERVTAGEEVIKFEIELWFRNSEERRKEILSSIRQLIGEVGGKLLSECMLEGISYHGILVEAPINVFSNLSDNSEVKLIKSDSVMFFRPVGQALITLPDSEEIEELIETVKGEIANESSPVVALFDGLPLQNHMLLKNRIILDDPDNYESYYQAQDRVHGTTMASLIIHGEVDSNEEPIKSPLYVRPIMKPNPRDWMQKSECIPEEMLPIDLIHRAVIRLFVGDDNNPPAAPSIKVINLSVGDRSREFDSFMSPWARLLDYLSYRYNVLFIVSAGNFQESIVINIDKNALSSIMNTTGIEKEFIENISNNLHNRRLLSPSESINSLTIGASHSDNSEITMLGRRLDFIKSAEFLSPISRVGLGYRRSIKPDLLFPGGRQLYLEDIMGHEGRAKLNISPSALAPGHRVAHPGTQGKINDTVFTRGTSNSTALASRAAIKIHEMLEDIRQTVEFGDNLTDRFITLLIKALLVHGAGWGNAVKVLEEVIRRPNDHGFRDKQVPRYLGYGFFNEGRVLNCTDQRVTLLGFCKIKKDEGQIFQIPLPPSLSSKKVKRRLAITLAWFSPINASNQKYRQAQLWFNPPQDKLGIKRSEADWQAVQRGTVQHEILEGENASPFLGNDMLEIKVSCREDAGGLPSTTEISYALVVTLEVAQGVNIPVYNEVRERIRSLVPVQTR